MVQGVEYLIHLDTRDMDEDEANHSGIRKYQTSAELACLRWKVSILISMVLVHVGNVAGLIAFMGWG